MFHTPLQFFLSHRDQIDQQLHSLRVILAYLISGVTTFRLDVLKFYNFLFYLRISELNPWIV